MSATTKAALLAMSMIIRLHTLLLFFSSILSLTACGHVERSVGTGVVRPSDPLPVVMVSTHGAFDGGTTLGDWLAIGPSWRLKLSGRGFDSIFGLEARLRSPGIEALSFRGGVDALLVGCTWRWCHAGTMGLLGGMEIHVARRRHYDWALGIEVDRDVRFGSQSDTSLMAVMRFTPRL